MNLDVSDVYRYMPLIPEWLVDALLGRREEYLVGYRYLASIHCGDPSVYYTAPNVSIEQINAYSARQSPSFGTLPQGWVLETTNTGQSWDYVRIRFDDPPLPPGNEYIEWSAMITGLACWQMYAVALTQQFIRLGQFGHFGPPK